MVWSVPRTFVIGQVVTAAMMNEFSDNLKVLKGIDGTVAIDAGITASGIVTGTDGLITDGTISGAALGISGVITGAGLNTAGKISGGGILNTAGVANVAGIVASSHISGATHVTTSGIVYAYGGIVSQGAISGSDALHAAGLITAGGGLYTPTHISCAGNISMASGMTVDGVDISVHVTDKQSSHGAACTGSAQIAATCEGQYTGTGAPNLGVPHSLGRTPYLVLINAAASGYYTANIFGAAPTQLFYQSAGAFGSGGTVTAMDDTNFYVGQSGRYAASMNLSGQIYYWGAVG